MHITPIVKTFEEAQEKGIFVHKQGRWELKESAVLIGATPILLCSTYVDVYPTSDLAVFGDHHTIMDVTFNCLGEDRHRPIIYSHGSVWVDRVGWWKGKELVYFNKQAVIHKGNLNEVLVGKLKPTSYFKNPLSPTQNEVDMLQLIDPYAHELVVDVLEYLKN